MPNNHPRLRRERRTIESMLRIYCRDHHQPIEGGLCAECAALHNYSQKRLELCPFQEKKPTCAKCPVHCYKPVERERIRVVMRYAGPRMIFRHPVLALLHLVDGLRKPPPISRRKPV